MVQDRLPQASLIVLAIWLLLSSHREALREARDQAAMRLLSEFNYKFLSDRDISPATYLEKLRDFQKANEDLHMLDAYVHYAEENDLLKKDGGKGNAKK